MDIVVEDTGARNGFLAITSQEYAAHIAFIINMTEEVMIMRSARSVLYGWFAGPGRGETESLRQL